MYCLPSRQALKALLNAFICVSVACAWPWAWCWPPWPASPCWWRWCEIFVESVQQAAETFGMGPAFVGFIVVALVGERSAWFVGVLLLMVYLIFAMTLYLLPPQ